MDRNAEMKWYLDQFSGSRERFYEIHMQMCRKFGISWSKATSVSYTHLTLPTTERV